jgi:hypothetical protein
MKTPTLNAIQALAAPEIRQSRNMADSLSPAATTYETLPPEIKYHIGTFVDTVQGCQTLVHNLRGLVQVFPFYQISPADCDRLYRCYITNLFYNAADESAAGALLLRCRDQQRRGVKRRASTQLPGESKIKIRLLD